MGLRKFNVDAVENVDFTRFVFKDVRYYEKPKKKELFEQKNFFDIFR
jgi:hypothetical protein